jgi:outer membrane protein assembly factor BamB
MLHDIRIGFSAALLLILLMPMAVAESGMPDSPDPLILSDSGLYAFDRESHQLLWSQLRGLKTSSPAVIHDLVVVGSSRGLYGFDLLSGELVWQRVDQSAGFSVVLDGERLLLAGQDGQLQAIKVTDGALIWQRQFSGWIYPPALSADLLVTGGSDGLLWAIDRYTGEVKWSLELDQEIVSSPVASDGNRIFASTFGREVIALDRTGKMLWRRHYPTVLTQPIVVAEQLFFNGYDQSLFAIDASNGAVHWRRQMPERLSTALSSKAGSIVAVMETGVVWELSQRSGKLLHEYRFPGEPIQAVHLLEGESIGFVRSQSGPKLVEAIFNMNSKEKRGER